MSSRPKAKTADVEVRPLPKVPQLPQQPHQPVPAGKAFNIQGAEGKPSQTMEQRLAQLVQEAPEAESAQKKRFWERTKDFCFSKLGVALLTFIFVFALLLILQPAYIYKKNQDNSHSLKHVNYALVSGISLIAAIIVVLIPLFIAKRKD
jgi:hypothetical protein